MRKALTSVLFATAISCGIVGVTATPAAAINKVDCTSSAFVKIWNQTGSERTHHCFANAGAIDVYITRVYGIWSGAQVINITYTDASGGRGEITIPRWSHREYVGNEITINRITIH
ncbi:beta/gamma crystallin domain-containing protein [Nonomuraea sp. LPB2021202275-12-8]|uniref:beta/gamma crystallin domain-containing protein n=1 Tax=Nonomuraea sp. LPB2021202275-12-8 TaxID=3120159 RepID=UPI003FA52E8B